MSTLVWIAVTIFLVVDLFVVVWFLTRRNKIKQSEEAGEAKAAGGPMPPEAAFAPPGVPPPAPAPETLIDKNVQFTVYRPNTIVPQKWYPLVAFAHLSKRREDAPADEPDPIKEVERQAAKILSDQPAKYEATKLDRGFSVPRKGMLTFVPLIEGCEFNPPSQSVLWQKTVHKVEFEMMAAADFDGKDVEGQMTVYLGHMILTEVPLRITIDSKFVAPETDQNVLTPISAEPYRKIFASYSHKDTPIVEDFENYVESLGDEYLRDVETLRSGQNWSEELERMIRDASVFQLFWSSNSMISPFVKQEWEYALGLGRKKFIRPVYWEEPLPKKEPELPPKALSDIHFYKLSIDPEEEKRGGLIPPLTEVRAAESQSNEAASSALPPGTGSSDAIAAQETNVIRLPQRRSIYPLKAIAAVALFMTFSVGLFGFLFFRRSTITISSGDPTPSPSPLGTPSQSPSIFGGDASPTISPTPQPSPTTSPVASLSPTPTPSPTPRPTATPTPTPTTKPTVTPTPIPLKPAISVNVDPPALTARIPSGSINLIIKNVGNDLIRQINVTESLPSDLAYGGSQPLGRQQAQTLSWQLGELPVGSSRAISIVVRMNRHLRPGEKYTPKLNTRAIFVDSQGRRHRYEPR